MSCECIPNTRREPSLKVGDTKDVEKFHDHSYSDNLNGKGIFVGGYVKSTANDVGEGREKEYQEILYAMEAEFMDCKSGSDIISWIRSRKEKHPEQLQHILRKHGLPIFRRTISDDDCKFINTALPSDVIKSFEFVFSEGFSNFTRVWKDQENFKLKAEEVCFAGLSEMEEASEQIIEFVALCYASRLILKCNAFTVEGLKSLKNSMQRQLDKFQIKCLKALELHHNNDVGSKGWIILAEIAGIFPRSSLELSTCDFGLKDEYLTEFLKNLHGTKLKSLDISGNCDLSEEGFGTFGKIVKCSDASSVAMTSCKLNSAKLVTFCENADKKIPKLNLSDNPLLGKDDPTKLKTSIEKLHVETLKMAGCELEKLDLSKPVQDLDVSENEELKEFEGIAKCVSANLSILDCYLDESEVETNSRSLRDKVEETQKKLETIEIGEYRIQADVDVIDHLAKAFEGVSDVLLVQFPGMHDLDYIVLKEQLQQYQYKAIKISPTLEITGKTK